MKTLPTDVPLVDLISVSKVFSQGQSGKIRALDDICLRIEQNSFTAVVGASGSGKSTLLNILGGLDRPTSGTYSFCDISLQTMSKRDLARFRLEHVGFVFQHYHLLDSMTVIENVMLPLFYRGLTKDVARSQALVALSRVGLEGRASSRPNELSGGQQQRVAIARAVVNGPSMVLADEPTGALDTRTASDVLSIFADLRSAGLSVIMITHDSAVADRAESVLRMSDGRIAS